MKCGHSSLESGIETHTEIPMQKYLHVKAKYILVIIKKTQDGYFFTSMYATGTKIKSKHKNLKRIRI